MLTTILTVGALLLSSFAVPVFGLEYGNYCGRGYYNSNGRAPLDRVDRICQVHDICTAKGITDCECNIQLESLITNDINGNHKAKGRILSEMDSWIFEYYSDRNFCFRNYHFRYNYDFYIPAGVEGFNYLPFYPNQTLYDEGEAKEYWGMVKKGCLQLYTSLDSKEYDRFSQEGKLPSSGKRKRLKKGDTFTFSLSGYAVLYNSDKVHAIVSLLKWDGKGYREIFDPISSETDPVIFLGS